MWSSEVHVATAPDNSMQSNVEPGVALALQTLGVNDNVCGPTFKSANDRFLAVHV